MGQKVNPHGLRVGVIKDWDSRWYAREDKVGDLIVEDYNIRKYLKSTLYSAGIAKIEIERDNAKVKISIHCSRPGVIIGKGGTEIEVLRQKIEAKLGKTVALNIVEVRSPDLNAQLVAEKRKLRAVERPEVFRRMNSVQDQRSIPLQLFSGGPAGARDTAVMSNYSHYRPSCGNIQDIQRDIHRKIFVNDAKQGGVPKVSALPGVTCSVFPCCARARRGSPLLRRTD